MHRSTPHSRLYTLEKVYEEGDMARKIFKTADTSIEKYPCPIIKPIKLNFKKKNVKMSEDALNFLLESSSW